MRLTRPGLRAALAACVLAGAAQVSLGVAGCSARPAPAAASRPAPATFSSARSVTSVDAAPRQAPEPQPTPKAAVSPLEPAEREALRQRLASAYDLQAALLPEGAADAEPVDIDTAFGSIISRLVTAGGEWSVDLPPTARAVPGERHSALTYAGGDTLFFSNATGKPTRLVLNLELRTDTPRLRGDYFPTHERGELNGLYAYSAPDVRSVSDVVGLHPAGTLAVYISEDCVVHVRDLSTDKQRTLFGAYQLGKADLGCPAYPLLRTAVVRFDGSALVSSRGIWDLRTAQRTSLPGGPVLSSDALPAVDPSGRYVIRAVANRRAASPHSADSVWLVLHDLKTGAVIRRGRGMLTNRDALSFRQDPFRVCVTDYGDVAYSVPKLEVLAPLKPGPSGGCEVEPPRRASSALDDRLRAQICSLGGFPIPIRFCPSTK